MSAMTITEFLLARIAEDEAAARAAMDAATEYAYFGGTAAEALLGLAESEGADTFALLHFGRHRPARVLAECEARRRVVERCRPRYAVLYRESERLLADAFDAESVKTVGHSGPIWPFPEVEAVLRDLAAVYVDHPDYDEAWRP